MKKSNLSSVFILILIYFCGTTLNAQSIAPTNLQGNKPMPCWDCAPANWFDFGGTPDMSNRNQAAASGTTGGGTAWSSAPLPLPPNGHTNWITIRDIGPAPQIEESVGTNITGLISGREYELVIYTITSLANTYSPNYIDRFDFQVGSFPRVNVTSINNDTNTSWGVNRLKFIANNSSMQLAFYPGSNVSNSSSYESVNISVSLNAINTIPVVQPKSTTTEKNVPVSINIFVGSEDYDAGQSVVMNTLDLDVTTPGIQGSITTPEGIWSVNDTTGFLIFTPATDFIGVAVLPYTIQDNFSLDGVASPGTSTSKNISVNVVEEICTEEVDGGDFYLENGETITFNQPATNYGFQFDVYSLDNSFNLEINGIMLATQEIQFQSNGTSGINIRFADGDQYEIDTEEIWAMTGNAATPLIRVTISPTGTVSMFGSKTSGGSLEPLELFNGNSFNTILWNAAASNTITASQSVIGETNMTGHGSGLNIIPCTCVKPGNSGTPAGFGQVGILTKASPSLQNWPQNVPNVYLVLDSDSKGMVITHMNTSQRDALDAIDGMLIYNTDLNCVQLYRGNSPDIDNLRTGWNCIKRGCNDY